MKSAPATIDVPALVNAVQRNCDISDARHAGDYTLCTYLLKMREFYRWENEIPYFSEVPQDDLGAWLTARERRWEDVEDAPLEPLPLDRSGADPFDNDAVNSALVPHGYVYSGGYGRYSKPLFFLGRLLKREQRAGFTVLVSSCEYARELAAPPAMLRGRTIFLRWESARRFVWEKIEESRWHKQDNAMRRAMDYYDFTDGPAALEAMTASAVDVMLLHELGEGLTGEALGPEWADLVAYLARSRAEAIARALRDHLADCRSTLPGLCEHQDPARLHFYFANLDGIRRAIFSGTLDAYHRFLDDGDWTHLRRAAANEATRWLDTAHEILRVYGADPERARERMDALLPREESVKSAACSTPPPSASRGT